MNSNHDTRFIKPCRHLSEKHRALTADYANLMISSGRVVQINLDNCTLQRMEALPEAPTISDVEKVGLSPLVHILNTSPVCMTAMGIHEMPDVWVAQARQGYEKFCKNFWPGHSDDDNATQRSYDASSTERRVHFGSLDPGARVTYGCAYVSLLQIQHISRRYAAVDPLQRFEIYLHSMIGLLGIVSGFELELAKYAFWPVDAKMLDQLPSRVQQRRRDIKENFTKLQPTLEKCRAAAFNGAMDIHWLSGANFAEDLDLSIDIHGRQLKIDCWVATNDHKLYRICEDIHSVYGDGTNMMFLAVARDALDSLPYWQGADRLSQEILRYRNECHIYNVSDLLPKIDNAVLHIESELLKLLPQST